MVLWVTFEESEGKTHGEVSEKISETISRGNLWRLCESNLEEISEGVPVAIRAKFVDKGTGGILG